VRSRVSRGLPVVATALTVLVTATPAAAADGDWSNQTPSVPVKTIDGELRDVTAAGADAWTVGSLTDALGTHPYAGHWTGTAWTDVSPKGDGAELRSIDLAAAGDAWAAGSADGRALILRSTLGNAFAPVTVPDPAAGMTDELDSVDMLSATEGWAVGTETSAVKTIPLILHRTGGQWARVALPDTIGGGSELTAVHARSATDVWLAGTTPAADRQEGALLMHWDGKALAVVPVPDAVAGSPEELTGVLAVSATEVWAVGSACRSDRPIEICASLVWHLTGGAWRREPMPGGAELEEVVEASPGDVYVVGYSSDAEQFDRDYVAHWSGGGFTTDLGYNGIPPHPQGQPGSALNGAAGDGGGRVWAVGWFYWPTTDSHSVHAVRRG
jgi:hypothetical protein